jgi:hypothetical protein
MAKDTKNIGKNGASVSDPHRFYADADSDF